MLYRFLTLIFTLAVIVDIPLSSQEVRYRSDLITRENGLSNSSVSCILKDKYGFLWFGTWNGLNRYDGYEMKVFLSDVNDSLSISNGNINTLYEDRDGMLWIATDNGLNSYDQITGRFKRYFLQTQPTDTRHNNQIVGIAQDTKGLIWVGCMEDGLFSLDKNTGIYKQFVNPFSDKSNSVIALLSDNLNDNYLWLGTADGLFLLNKKTGTFTRESKGIKNASMSVQVIIQDLHGDLYLGTWGNGLIKYDRKTANLSSCSSSDPNDALIHNSIIRAMSLDSKGNLLFIVRDKGLMIYNPVTGKMHDLDAEDVNSDLNNKAVTSMYLEPSGIIWVGTIYDGVIKIVTLLNSFKYYNPLVNVPDAWNGGGVTAILEDSEGYLWLGTRFGGLLKINRKNQQFVIYKQTTRKNNCISSNNILSLLEATEAGRRYIWIGTDGGGLNRLEPSTGKFKVFKTVDTKSAGPSSNSVSSIIRYDNDHLLIGTRDRNMGEGLDVFNIKTGQFINLRNDPLDSTSLGSNNLLKLFMDRSGTVWIGTRNGGLNKFVIKDINAKSPGEIGYFIRYTNDPSNPKSLINNTIYSIHDDSENNLWIGTNEGGLSKFDKRTGSFTGKDLHQYLINHLVYGILADENENLWISASRGIISLNLITNEVHSFDQYDGLQETAFIYGSYYKSASGEMFFGGIKGCHSFHPDSIKLNLQVPEIVITSFNLNGKKGNRNVSTITGKSVLASKLVRSTYDQNNFSITFSALDFQMPEKNRFKYILEGYDKDWTETDASRRYVNYTNLPPGKYIFRVIGSNSDDIWNHKGTSVSIIIAPPFWRTTAFFAGLLFILAAIAGFIFYLILKRYQREKRQVKQEALSLLKDERKQLRTLIDNIPDLIFIKDRQSRFTMANLKVAHVMGSQVPENLLGKTDFDFYPVEVARAFYEDEQKIMNTGVSMINKEETARDENGNRVIRSTTKVPVRNENGEIIGVAGICRDITKLKQIELQLRKKSEDLQETNRLLEGRQKEILIQSEELAEQTQNLLMINAELDRVNRTKDKFFSIIAHDLRNPFNAIIGFSELLRVDFNSMENAQKLNVVELINVSSQTAYNLLENLLQWARTQTDKIKIEPENFDLSEIASTVIDLHCVIARKKSIKIRNKVAPNTFVHADKNMINTVLRNLISNAIKFSNPDSEINITVNHKNQDVEVNVTDEGIGMNHENLGKLFRIDTYYSTSGTMGESGTGLGLIICKEFIEKNNGRIRATSAEGGGTTMTFTLNPAKMN